MYAAAALFFPYVQFRPNRVLTGESLRLLKAAGKQGILLVLVMLLLSLLMTLMPRKLRLPRATIPLAAFFVSLLSLSVSARLLSAGNEVARVSMGSGFYISIAGVFLMFSAARGEIADRKGLYKGMMPALLLVFFVLLFSGAFDALSVMREYFNRREAFLGQVARHLALASSAVGMAALLGIPLAFVLFSRKRLERAVFFFVNLGQTIPTLSLLGLLMVPLGYLGQRSGLLRDLGVSGVGFWPAWIALFIYALFPVLHNALAGLQMVDPAVTEAARSVGMTKNQVFYKVQIPLAVPLMVSGVRTSLTQSMGNAVLAALIGGGGLGSLIFLGLAQSAPDLILLGTLPLVMMTFLIDALLHKLVMTLDKGGPL